MAALNDVIFLRILPEGQRDCVINVYNRNNIAVVEDVIPLPGMRARKLVACHVSNCLYIMNAVTSNTISVLRITKIDEHQFDMSTLIGELFLRDPDLTVTPNGCLILSRRNISRLSVIRIYDANGSLQHMISLSPKIAGFCNIIPKSNGNLVLVSNSVLGSNRTVLTQN